MFEKYARDILSDRYYLWIEKLPSPAGLFFLIHAAVIFAITSIITFAVYGYTDQGIRIVASVMMWAWLPERYGCGISPGASIHCLTSLATRTMRPTMTVETIAGIIANRR